MKITTGLVLCFVSLPFFGCSGGNSSSSASKTRAQIFSDSSVTAFSQTAGVALSKPTFMDNLLGRAYAIDGNISCVEGAPVSFSLDAFGNTVMVDTSCNSSIDLSIRQGLLESLAGKTLIAEIGGCPGCNILGQGRILNFNSVGSFWGTYDNVVSGGSANCKDKYTFDQATGSVTIEHDVASSVAAGAVSQDCLDNEFPGATLDDYKQILNFRFINGKMEFDLETDFEDNGDYNRWCIKSVATNTCQ